MKKQNILLLGLWALVVIGFAAMSKLHAQKSEGDEGPTAQRVTTTDGTHRVPFRINVGSMAATSPYSFTPSTSVQEALDPTRADRCMAIKNPSTSFELMVGTWSSFTSTDQYFGVTTSSGSYSDCAHEQFWLRYPPGSSSQTVSIMQTTSGEVSQ